MTWKWDIFTDVVNMVVSGFYARSPVQFSVMLTRAISLHMKQIKK